MGKQRCRYEGVGKQVGPEGGEVIGVTEVWRRVTALRGSQSGFSTAELLGNAALAIVALVAIWALLQTLGVDVINWIKGQILGG
jgi:hypothetical protein